MEYSAGILTYTYIAKEEEVIEIDEKESVMEKETMEYKRDIPLIHMPTNTSMSLKPMIQQLNKDKIETKNHHECIELDSSSNEGDNKVQTRLWHKAAVPNPIIPQFTYEYPIKNNPQSIIFGHSFSKSTDFTDNKYTTEQYRPINLESIDDDWMNTAASFRNSSSLQKSMQKQYFKQPINNVNEEPGYILPM